MNFDALKDSFLEEQLFGDFEYGHHDIDIMRIAELLYTGCHDKQKASQAACKLADSIDKGEDGDYGTPTYDCKDQLSTTTLHLYRKSTF